MRGEIRRRDEDAAHPTDRREPVVIPEHGFPAWLFWVVSCAIAVVAGVGVAYFGSPESGTPLETSAPAGSALREPASSPSETPTAARDPGRRPAPGAGSGSIESAGSDGSGAAQGSGGNRSGFAGDILAQFQGTQVQVLNASNRAGARSHGDPADPEGLHHRGRRDGAPAYRRTTVFWTPNRGRRAALALAQHFGWRAAPKPGNLTDGIPVHVVVGEDELAKGDASS